MNQQLTTVPGYRGELTEIRLLPEGDPSLERGPEFVEIARKSLGYLSRNPLPDNGYQCRFSFFLLGYPPGPVPRQGQELVDPIATADTESRNDIAFNQMREISGSDVGRKAQDEVHKRLVGYLRSGSGKMGDNMCWAVPYCMSADVGKTYAMEWTTCKLLQSEVDLYRLTKSATHKKLARRVFEGLKRMALWDSGRAYYPYGVQPWDEPPGNGYNGHYPHVVGPVTDYWLYCKDPEGLKFAEAMTEGFIADIQPNNLHMPDGSARGHNHVQMHAVRGVAQLGSVTRNPRYLNWAKEAYDYYEANAFDTGWLPERIELLDHCYHSETCLTSDMLEIETWLARAGWPEYWDRVDRTIRNYIVPSQFVLTPEIEALYREANPGRTKAEIDGAIAYMRELEGGFMSALTPNDFVFDLRPNGVHDGIATARGRKVVLDMMGCCPPEGMRAIYFAWKNTVQKTDEGVLINLAFDHDGPVARVESDLPGKGHVNVTAKTKSDYLLRVPGWVPRSEVKATRDGKTIDPVWGGPACSYIIFASLTAGESVEITFPLVEFKQKVSMQYIDPDDGKIKQGQSYTYHWVGSQVTEVEPQAEWLPIYRPRPCGQLTSAD